MALSFAAVTAKGFDGFEALLSGQMQNAFTYDLINAPDVMKQPAYIYRDPIIMDIMLSGGIVKGQNSSDQIRWAEFDRIQNVYNADVDRSAWASGTSTLDFSGSATDLDIRTGETLIIAAGNLWEQVAVTAVSGTDVTIKSYLATPIVVATTGITVFHLSSEFKQGSDIPDESVTRKVNWLTNNNIIVKDYQSYDRSQIQHMTQFTDDLTRYMIDTEALDKRFDIKVAMAAVFGVAAEAGSGAAGVDLNGSKSVVDFVKKAGNTVSGTFADKTDLDNLVLKLNAIKGAKTNVLALDLQSALDVDNALASISPNAANEYNFGNFPEGVDYRKLGFKGYNNAGWEIAYGHWEILDDKTYFGALEGNTSKPKGLLIPKGKVALANGGSTERLSMLVRDGMDKLVSKDGAVFGIGHKDVASIGYTLEFAPRVVAAKDFMYFA